MRIEGLRTSETHPTNTSTDVERAQFEPAELLPHPNLPHPRF